MHSILTRTSKRGLGFAPPDHQSQSIFLEKQIVHSHNRGRVGVPAHVSICGKVVFRSATAAGAVEKRDLLVLAAAQTAVTEPLLRRAISGRDGAETFRRARLGAAEELLGGGCAGRAARVRR